MPFNPQNGMWEQGPPSLFPSGMFSGPLEAINNQTAMEHDQRRTNTEQLQNLLLGLSAREKQRQYEQQGQALSALQGLTPEQQQDPNQVAAINAIHGQGTPGVYSWAGRATSAASRDYATDTRAQNVFNQQLTAASTAMDKQGLKPSDKVPFFKLLAGDDEAKKAWVDQYLAQAPDQQTPKAASGIGVDQARTTELGARVTKESAQAAITKVKMGEIVKFSDDNQQNIQASAELKRAAAMLDVAKQKMLGVMTPAQIAHLQDNTNRMIGTVRMRLGNSDIADEIVAELHRNSDALFTAAGRPTHETAGSTVAPSVEEQHAAVSANAAPPQDTNPSTPDPNDLGPAPQGAVEGQTVTSSKGRKAIVKNGRLILQSGA